MTPDMQRLLDYAKKFVPNGEWTPNGEDAEESLNNLEEMGLIERHMSGTLFRLSEIEQIDLTFPVFETDTVCEINREEISLTKTQIQELINAAFLAVKGDDLCCLRNIIKNW
jgi:predicted transcriptional regulator